MKAGKIKEDKTANDVARGIIVVCSNDVFKYVTSEYEYQIKLNSFDDFY